MSDTKKPITLDLLEYIQNGDYDVHLETLTSAIISRKRVLKHKEALTNLTTIQVGDHVELCNTNPKYLNGLRAEIHKVLEDSFSCILFAEDRPFSRRFKDWDKIIIPASGVKKIGD